MHNNKILSLSLITSVFVLAGCIQTQTATTTNDTVNENTLPAQTGNVEVVTNTNATVSNENTNTIDTSGEVDTNDPALSEVEGWLTYTNDEYGFSFRYPREWEVNVLDENTLGLVSLERKSILSNSPTEPNSDFYLILNKPATSAPYIEDNFRPSLEKSEKKGFIKDLSFMSDNRAIFVEHNDFSDLDQNVQYVLLNSDLIISVAYLTNAEHKQIIEYVINSLYD